MRRVLPLGLLAVLVIAVSACGGEVQQGSKARLLPEVRQELSPGEYRSEEFEPSLSFRVDEGWSTSPPELSDALLITRGGTGGLGFASAREVYKSTKTGMPDVVEAPEDMVGWFQHHPYLRTGEPEPVTVGGI